MTVEARSRSTPSRPKPNSAVWISWLYFRLTVVMKSAYTNAPFEKIDLPEKFHLRDGEQIPGQREQRQSFRREQALISHVVNRENCAHLPERRVFDILRAQQTGTSADCQSWQWKT